MRAAATRGGSGGALRRASSATPAQARAALRHQPKTQRQRHFHCHRHRHCHCHCHCHCQQSSAWLRPPRSVSTQSTRSRAAATPAPSTPRSADARSELPPPRAPSQQ
eukprot:3475263-Pleurochrysis_carterae.AAC.1